MLEDFWGSLGLCHFFTLAGGAQVSWTQIERSLLADRYRGDSNWNPQNWGPSHWFAPMYSCFLDFLHLFIEKPPKVDYAAEREGRFCKILHWQRPNKDRNFQCHRWALKNYLWLFQVGNSVYCCRKGQRNDARCESCLLGFTEKNHEVSHGMRVFIDWSRCVTMHVLVFDEACFRIVSVRKCISFHSGNLSDQYPLVIFGPSAISTTAQVSIPQLLDLTLLHQLIPHLKCRCQAQPQKWADQILGVVGMNHDLIHGRTEKWKDAMFTSLLGNHCICVHCICWVLEAVDRWNAVVRNCHNYSLVYLSWHFLTLFSLCVMGWGANRDANESNVWLGARWQCSGHLERFPWQLHSADISEQGQCLGKAGATST